jgi:uncharacterized membrane protein
MPLPVSLAEGTTLLTKDMMGLLLAGNLFHPPLDGSFEAQLLLRLFHFLAGVIWIGHLYYFNLVNVNLMKALDGPTKGKVIPQLMPRALWWFRWGALITVLAGLTYYAMYIVAPDHHNVSILGEKGPMNIAIVLLVWLLIVVIAFGIEMFIMRSVNDGRLLGVIVGVLVSIMAIVLVWWLNSSLSISARGITEYGASNKTLSIGIGGGIGVMMLFNVWGIIWPYQKRIISWTADNAENGTAVPAESAKLARIAFLASRTNTWLSVPMLLFMAASSHYPMLGK